MEIFSGQNKKSCRKMAKMRQKHPISKKSDAKKTPMDLCGENRKIKNNSQKKQKNPIAKNPDLYCIVKRLRNYKPGKGIGY